MQLNWLKNNKRGVLFVEFAIIMPLLVFFLIAILYFGMFMHDHVSLNNLARNAVRYAAVDNSGTNLTTKETKIQAYLNGIATDNLLIYTLDASKVKAQPLDALPESGGSIYESITKDGSTTNDTINITLSAKKVDDCPIFIDDLLPGTIKSTLKMQLEVNTTE